MEMQELPYDTEDPICALATPWAPSALAVVRTSGKGCIEAFARFFSRPQALLSAPGNTALHGRVVDAFGATLDDVVVTVFRAPASSTGQDVVEVSCHGSLPGLKRILGALTGGGFRPANPGEFTLRAFLNGKVDLTKAEAVQEIVAAKTSRAQALALDRLSGAITGRIQAMKEGLLNVVALLNIQLDYAEDDVETLPVPFEKLTQVRDDARTLAATYRTGKVYQEGLTVVLVGQTNAGKSSLFNLFLKEDRSIVSDEHGTTRDWLEAWASLDGLPVRLVDTAGLRDTDNKVEREGIRRSRELVDAADVVVYLVDGTRGADDHDRAFLDAHADDPRLVVVSTKADLVAPDRRTAGLWVSSHSGDGFAALEDALRARVPGHGEGSGAGAVVDSLRQKQLLERTADAVDRVLAAARAGVPLDMVFVDVKEALDALGEITGEVTTADILTRMFSGFCVGK
jgi:tRNA modification GTPase